MPASQIRAGLVLVALSLCAAPAIAQDVDTIDRITGQASPSMGARAPEGVKVVAPGALVFARFDADLDGRITAAEIEAGAAVAFAAADANDDQQITGFEQTDWAARMGNPSDLMANAMTFDIDLDRSVTRAEFTAGLKRIAGQIQPNGDLTFADLLQPLSRSSQQAQRGPVFGPTRGRDGGGK